MQTFHRIIYRDSRKLDLLDDESINLVVTSPPYPMIEMWDDLFTALNPDIGIYLERSDYRKAFESMHRVLDEVWLGLFRVMKAGALACINIGDATRTMGDRFQLFANHSRIQSKCLEMGFEVLPSILWRKPTNAPNKFMGSGMLPAGAYVTLEHEYILILRKGGKRTFSSPEDKKRRRESAYFWEERNSWFSDIWDLKGAGQEMNDQDLRQRSAAYPFLLPFRLINMYSLIGDTVLDPFLGTATTSLAAIACGRNSVGYEIDSGFAGYIKRRIEQETAGLSHYNLQRVKDHIEFAREYAQNKGALKYLNRHFGFPVMTRQEKELKLPFVKSVEEVDENLFKAAYLDDVSVKKELDLKGISIGKQLCLPGLS
ncbi:MAG TPA: site-specific DNA-methyltransferase [Bacillota bacterium]|nr:site-specific DNA-methyltransferase [Bacillota bacterium]HOA36408.1 site-specific DNA-methyltransferase [Bacillota bacterium]HOJ83975.1 site-specific DNA-methyltransferase [Bacillota bacterium]HOL15218.1 site-specific DNA-methyltransferase [Bacillota bacterium]HPZ12446.1 site-specific DNA-methyltransferase [Bacillota bacterium]